MLQKMRLRMILSSMLAFFAVITLIAVLVNVADYIVMTNRVDQTLDYILSYEERIPNVPEQEGPPPAGPGPFMEIPDVEANYMTRFFVVRFDLSGNPIFASTDYVAAVDKEAAVEYAQEALSKGDERGYISDYRYVVQSNGVTTVVIFLNASKEIQYMRTLGSLSLFVSGVSLLLVFALVVLFSGKAIKPIADNIKTQKQFITNASHELKTPITSISTSIDVLSIEHGDDEWTENIKSQVGRMSKLVGELVTLSRLDEDIPVPNKEKFSLSNAAWETVEVYEPHAKAEGKNFQVSIEDDVYMTGDKAAIQRMLSVLIDNAIKYSDENGDIKVSVCKTRLKNVIAVYNTCDYDVPPDTDRLFDRFYRPDESRSTSTGGNGIGMAIAKAVVEAHGGTITAHCPSGKSMDIRVLI